MTTIYFLKPMTQLVGSSMDAMGFMLCTVATAYEMDIIACSSGSAAAKDAEKDPFGGSFAS